jgi:hypothetical protein
MQKESEAAPPAITSAYLRTALVDSVIMSNGAQDSKIAPGVSPHGVNQTTPPPHHRLAPGDG